METVLSPRKPLSSLTCRQGPHGGDWVRHRRDHHWHRQEAEGEVPRVQGKPGGRAACWEPWSPWVFLSVLLIKPNWKQCGVMLTLT